MATKANAVRRFGLLYVACMANTSLDAVVHHVARLRVRVTREGGRGYGVVIPAAALRLAKILCREAGRAPSPECDARYWAPVRAAQRKQRAQRKRQAQPKKPRCANGRCVVAPPRALKIRPRLEISDGTAPATPPVAGS